MPIRTQARPTAAPAAQHVPEQGPTPTGGLAQRRQDKLGNQAVQESLGLGEVCETGPDPVADAQAALRANTDDISLSVSGRVAERAQFGEAGETRAYAREATRFEVGVGRQGVWATFDPQLVLVPGSIWAQAATGGIGLSSLRYDLRTGKASLKVDLGLAGAVLDPFFGVRGHIEAAFADAVTTALPAGVGGGGYDPYTDPLLSARLSRIVAAFSSCFPAGEESEEAPDPTAELLERIGEPELTLRVGARAMEAPLDDGLLLRLAPGAKLTLTARLGGTMRDAVARPSLRALELVTEGLTIEHPEAGLLGGVDLHGITFGPDLAVTDLRYTLGAEIFAGLVQALSGGAKAGKGVASPRLDALRQQLDAEARARLPTLLRDQVRALATEVPGLPLEDLLGAGEG